MSQDVITYLKRSKDNIRHMMPGLEPINDSYRFDSRRFDILACSHPDSKIYGIKDIGLVCDAKELQKLVKDAEWIQRYQGSVIILIPAVNRRLDDLFDDETSGYLGCMIKKYYINAGKGYVFMDTLEGYAVARRARIEDTASKILTSPKIIDQVLRQFEKRSPAIRLVREVYNAYLKMQK